MWVSHQGEVVVEVGGPVRCLFCREASKTGAE